MSFVDSVSVICIFEVREDVIHELFGCADSLVELFVRYLNFVEFRNFEAVAESLEFACCLHDVVARWFRAHDLGFCGVDLTATWFD